MLNIAMIAGGDPTSLQGTYDYYVGIDRGSLFLLENKLPLTMAIGDFDSVSKRELMWIKEQAQSFIQSPAEKNDTDTELALKEVFKRFPRAQVTIYAAFGGRLDHLLSNVFLPSDPEIAPFMQQIQLCDDQNQLSYLPKGQHLVYPQEGMAYVSFMTEGEGQLIIKNAKYELAEANFFKKKIYSSNEFANKPIELSLSDGYALVIQTKDRG